MKAGRKPNLIRLYFISEYGLTPRQVRRIDGRFLEQLIACKSEEARRILLGVSNKDSTED